MGLRRSALSSLRLHPATPLVAALVVIIGFLIHGPYLSAPLILDDITTLDLQGQWLTGRTSLFAYVFTFFETLHFQATWKLVLLGVAKCWGIWPVPYHVLVVGSQAASAFLLYLFLSRQGTSRVVAALGAVLWSGAAFGRWDNVLLFVNSGSHVFSMCFLLAAMLLLRAMSRNPTTTNTVLFVVAEVGVILSFSSDTIFLLALPIQWWLLEGAPPRTRKRVLLTWSIPFALGVFFELGVSLILWLNRDSSGQGGMFDLVSRVASVIGLQFADALFALLGTLPPPVDDTAGIPRYRVVVMLAVLFAAGAWLWRSAGWKLIVPFAVPPLCVAISAAITRGASGADGAVQGRYVYPHALFWVVLAVACAEPVVPRILLRRNARFAGLAGAVGVLVLMGFLAGQYRLASAARSAFDALAGAEGDLLEAQGDALASILKEARENGRPAVLVDVPVPLAGITGGATPNECVLLSSLAAVAVGRSDATIFVPLPVANEAQISAFRGEIANTEYAIRTLWEDVLEAFKPDVAALIWLDEFARRTGRRIRLPSDFPNYPFVQGNMSVYLRPDDALTVLCRGGIPFTKDLADGIVGARGPVVELKELGPELRRMNEPPARDLLNMFSLEDPESSGSDSSPRPAAFYRHWGWSLNAGPGGNARMEGMDPLWRSLRICLDPTDARALAGLERKYAILQPGRQYVVTCEARSDRALTLTLEIEKNGVHFRSESSPVNPEWTAITLPVTLSEILRRPNLRLIIEGERGCVELRKLTVRCNPP